MAKSTPASASTSPAPANLFSEVSSDTFGTATVSYLADELEAFTGAVQDSYDNGTGKGVTVTADRPVEAVEKTIRKAAQDAGCAVTVRKFNSTGKRTTKNEEAVQVAFLARDKRPRKNHNGDDNGDD